MTTQTGHDLKMHMRRPVTVTIDVTDPGNPLSGLHVLTALEFGETAPVQMPVKGP